MNNHFIHAMLADVFELQDKLDAVLLKEHHDKLISNFVMSFRQKMLSKAYANAVDMISHKYNCINMLDIQQAVTSYLLLLEQSMLVAPMDVNAYFNDTKNYISHIASSLMLAVVTMTLVYDSVD